MPSEAAVRAFRLPADATSFVGRDAELKDVLVLLDSSRLVTVTGTAGVGKTRLALRAATLAAARYPDGICLTELSGLRDPLLLPDTLASEFGLTGSAPADAVVSYLRDREMLLILDTCEHLADACRDFAAEVTRKAPGVTVLATSRQPLLAPGEAVYPVAPLAVGNTAVGTTGAGTTALTDTGGAVDLFAQRATSAVPSFAVTSANRDDVVRLCERLAGIPLAIELAAVRLRALSVRQLADGLAEHVLSLTGSRRTALSRHRELRRAIGWSYDLCTPDEKELWARLSVFAGSFDLAAAADVCGDSAGPRGADIEPVLLGLAHKSVLLTDTGTDGTDTGTGTGTGTDTGTPRYRMLDSLREFGAELLRASGTETSVRTRHISRYLALARRLGDHPMDDQLAQFRTLGLDHDEIRATIEYALTVPGNDKAAVTIVTSLTLYWCASARLREAEYWLGRVLERCPPRAPARAQVLVARALILIQLGDPRAAQADAEAGIEIARKFGDTAAVARGSVALHEVFTWNDELAEASAIAREQGPVLEAADDAFYLALLDIQTGLGHLQAKDPAGCIVTCERGLARLPEDELWAHSYLIGLGGAAEFLMGHQQRGASGMRAALMMKRELGDTVGAAYAVGLLGVMAVAQGQLVRAAWLLGSSGTLWEHTGHWYGGNPFLEGLHRLAAQAAASELGEERWRLLTGRAATASMDEIVALAISDEDVGHTLK
jgi:non-specific serine/threonine protein kinase